MLSGRVGLTVESYPLFIMVIICGKNAIDPARVARMCEEHPVDRVLPLPWVKEMKDLVAILEEGSGLPNRVVPCKPNLEEEGDADTFDFDPKLEDDAFGLMANALKNGRSVLNQTMNVPCPHGFYGRVITHQWQPEATAIVRGELVDELFPDEPVSAKMYATTMAPVLFKNTDAFRKLTGIPDEGVSVLAATDFIPRIVTFMTFHKLMTGMDFVFSVEPEKFPGPPPLVWRYNRAYRINYVAEILR